MATPELSPCPSRLRALFDAVVELPAAERERFLAGLGGGDNELRAELLSLLEVHDRAGDFLEDSPLASLGRHLDPERLVGDRLGDYRVVRPLGRGGMGTVYSSRATSW